MIKKITILTMLAILFGLAACAPAAPQNLYAAEMQPVIEQLPKWQDDFEKLEIMLTETIDAETGVNRLQLIELYNIAMEYKITRDDYSKLGLMPLDALVGPSTNLSKDGHSILDVLLAATPGEETKVDHQALVDCLQTRIAFAEELSSSIKDLTVIEMDKAGELVSCNAFPDALQRLTVYVDENK